MGDRNLKTFLHGSTKEIVTLVNSLPEKESILSKLGYGNFEHDKPLKNRRFNKHPRNINLENEHKEHRENRITVIKNPSKNMDSDSSDDLYDVTIRKSNNNSVSSETSSSNSSKNCKVGYKEVENSKCKQTKRVIRSSNQQQKCKPNKSTGKKSCELQIPKKSEPMLFYFDKKLQTVIEKSLKTLEEIKFLMERGIEAPDGSEDLIRRHKRAIEFSVRFSRIHLYQINLYTDDLEKMLKHSEVNCNVINLNQKFLTAVQTVYHALQAYFKHLPTSVAIGVPEKLKDLLKSASNLCNLFKENHDTNKITSKEEELIAEFKNKTTEMAEDIESILFRAKESVFTTKEVSKKNKLQRRGKNRKLGMYHNVPIRNDVYWKKAVTLLAQKKFDVPSRYKTATFKHRQRPNLSQTPPEKFPSRKSIKTKKISSRTIVNDMDNVTTMVQEDALKEFEVGRERSMLWKLANDFFQKVTNQEEPMSQEQYNCILEHFISIAKNGNHEVHIKNRKSSGKIEENAKSILENRFGGSIENMCFDDFVKKLLECLNEQKSNSEETVDEVVVKPIDKPVINYQEILSVTGEKNAKLICIKDNTPLKENSDEEKCVKQQKRRVSNKKSCEETKKLSDKNSTKGTKIMRFNHSNRKLLQVLPKDEILRILEYKLLFNKEMKSNYLYQKAEDPSLSPWNLVDRISEKLMEEALASIARDIQVDGILQKIYAKEFK